MVTEIIEQEDVRPYYTDINEWIRDGITRFAIYSLRDKYLISAGKFSSMDKIRNIYYLHPQNNKQPITKW